jgi:hypothetical protein
MANEDIFISVGIKDNGLIKGLQGFVKAVDKLTKATDKLQKKEKQVAAAEKQLIASNKQKLAVTKSLNAQRTKEFRATEKAIQKNKENIASLIEESRAQQRAMQTAADVARQKEKDRIATIKGKDARRANVLQIKKEEQANKKLFEALKKDIQARSKQNNSIRLNTNALNKNIFSLRGVGKGITDITNKGRLLNNTFATMRSKLLLASFGFSLVGASIGRNIKAFAEQEESVLRLGLQFGSQASGPLAQYASSLQKVTRFGDESINSVMAQFGAYGANIEQTRALTQATLDLAEGQQMDLNSAALLVAKSFGSSTNALQRYGITIDSSSSKQEKINQIITQSEKKYGGLAKLLGKMAGSEVKQLEMAFGDFRERLGEVLSAGLRPLIQGLTRFIEALNPTHIRIMTEAVASLTASFILLRTVGLGVTMVTAIIKAGKTLSKFAAIQLATKGVTVGLTTAVVVLKRALLGLSGGLGALLAIGTTVGVALFEMSGLFKETAEEEESAKEELDKYVGSLKTLRTEDAMGELDKFYQKLISGNNLLKIANVSFGKEITGTLSSIYSDIDKDALMKDANVLVAAAGEINDQIKAEQIKHGERVNEINEELGNIHRKVTIGRLSGEAKEAEMIRVEALKKEKAELTAHFNALKELRVPIMADIAKINQTFLMIAEGAEFKDKFIELTGVTSDFFDKYISGSAVMDSIQTGLISTNSDLVAVMQTVVDKDGKFLELSAEKQKAIIKEILLKQKLNKTNEEVADSEMKWADMSISAKSKLVGQSLKASAALLTSTGKNAKEGARLQQFAAIADTYAAASKSLNNPVKMFAIIAAGIANVLKIQEAIQAMGGSSSSGSSQIYGSYEHGGYVGGRRHSQGGTIIEAERGEFVMNRNAVEAIGLETLNQMNQGGVSGNINVNVTGNVLTQDFVEGELAESIKEAVRRGSDFGIG